MSYFDEDHPSAQTSLIVPPGPDCVGGGGLGRACTVPWLPAGQVCYARFLSSYRWLTESKKTSVAQDSGLLTVGDFGAWFSFSKRPTKSRYILIEQGSDTHTFLS